jgi:hypothetical protein
MRTVPFKTVVDAVVRLHGIDPRGDVPSDLLNAVVDHANARVETALLAWDWQEWNRTEERAYRQTWNAATQFKRVNGDGVPDEFFYIPNMTYYGVLATAVSDPPIGTLPTNTTYFTPITVLDTYLQYDQPCKRSIGQVLGIYSANPRTNCCNNGSCYRYHPSEFGVDICSGRGPTVFVWYQMPTPRYSMTPYLVGKTYNRGDVVFDPITGECYQALSTTTLAPASGPWNRVPFLQKWFNFVRFGAFADSLGEIDRSGTLDPNVQIAAGQNAEAKAMNALQQQIDSMVMQGQKLRWNFKGCGRYWCESLPWNGSGTVSTLTDECQADAGWVYPPEPGTVFVTEIIGVISGITPLIVGQDYIDVVFGSAQPSVDWTPLETSIVNTVDPTPVNVWPGVISNQTENGFRLQLNGTPDSGNYNLYWSIKGASGYFMAGPSTGSSGTPSTAFEVSLPDESGLIGTVIITPHDGGAGGTFTPSTVALTAAAPSATFTYTPSTYGSRSISVTNDRGITNPAARGFISVANAYTLSGPGSGVVGVPSTNFTVALPVGGAVIGTVTVTPNDGGAGGTFIPSTVDLTTAAPSATFTYTPASTGSKTISATNSGGLTNPAPLTYSATAPFVDTFTGTSALTAHTADTGHTWGVLITGLTCTMQVASGSLYDQITSTPEVCSNYTPATADQDATITLIKQAISGAPEAGIWLRATIDATNPRGYMGRFVEGTGFQFYRLDPGQTYVQLGSNVAATLANGDTLRFTVTGTGATVTLTLYKNGVQVAQTTDNNANRIVSNGKVGLHLHDPLTGGTNNYRIDQVSAT